MQTNPQGQRAALLCLGDGMGGWGEQERGIVDHCLDCGDHFISVWWWFVHAQSCPILSDPMDHSPPGSSVHGILQARMLEWIAISSSIPLFFTYQSGHPENQHQPKCGFLYSGDQLVSVPGGASGKEPVCQGTRRHWCRFNSWVGKIPWRRAQPYWILQYYLESPMDRGAWRAGVHGVGQSGARPKRFSSSSSSVQLVASSMKDHSWILELPVSTALAWNIRDWMTLCLHCLPRVEAPGCHHTEPDWTILVLQWSKLFHGTS